MKCGRMLLAFLLAAGSAGAAVDYTPLVIEQTVDPVFPRELSQLAVTDGYAKVRISVDETGRLDDWLVTGYSHPDFAAAAVRALRQWKFAPARLDGRPLGVTQEVVFRFESHQFVVNQNGIEAVETRVFQMAAPDYAYRVYRADELDAPPVAVHTVAPVCPPAAEPRGAAQVVSVDFYIDEEGRVRLPAVAGVVPPELGLAAVAALTQWRFQPPRHDGRPVLVQARQAFVFEPRP